MRKAKPNIGVKYENVQLRQLFVLMKRVDKTRNSLFIQENSIVPFYVASLKNKKVFFFILDKVQDYENNAK